MNAKQTNRLDSYTATEQLLKGYAELAEVPGLPAKLALLSARLADINRLAKTQTQPIQARTTERNVNLSAMTERTLEIAGFVRTVARELALPQLALAVQVGIGSFRRARRSHRVWFAQRVLEAARTVAPQLGTFGVTDESLDALDGLIQTATETVNLPRETVAVKKAATQQLAELIMDVGALLKDEIDPLVFPLRKTRPEFYAAYRAARTIVDRRGGRSAAEEAVTPASPGPETASPPTAENRAA